MVGDNHVLALEINPQYTKLSGIGWTTCPRGHYLFFQTLTAASSSAFHVTKTTLLTRTLQHELQRALKPGKRRSRVPRSPRVNEVKQVLDKSDKIRSIETSMKMHHTLVRDALRVVSKFCCVISGFCSLDHCNFREQPLDICLFIRRQFNSVACTNKLHLCTTNAPPRHQTAIRSVTIVKSQSSLWKLSIV